jgi:hypothetical protein
LLRDELFEEDKPIPLLLLLLLEAEDEQLDDEAGEVDALVEFPPLELVLDEP